MLSELIYISDRRNIGDHQEIKDILSVCQKNNSGKVTGVLLYSSKKFVQYLEGEYQNIKGLYEKIKKDSRHYNVQLVVFSPIKERVFPGWLMAEKNLDEDALIIKNTISDQEREIFLKLLQGDLSQKHSLSRVIKKFFV